MGNGMWAPRAERAMGHEEMAMPAAAAPELCQNVLQQAMSTVTSSGELPSGLHFICKLGFSTSFI